MKVVVFKSAEGFFLAPALSVAQSKQGNITCAALEQRISPFYSSQEAAEKACDEKQTDYNEVQA